MLLSAVDKSTQGKLTKQVIARRKVINW